MEAILSGFTNLPSPMTARVYVNLLEGNVYIRFLLTLQLYEARCREPGDSQLSLGDQQEPPGGEGYKTGIIRSMVSSIYIISFNSLYDLINLNAIILYYLYTHVIISYHIISYHIISYHIHKYIYTVYSLIIYIICVMETFPSAHRPMSHPEFHGLPRGLVPNVSGDQRGALGWGRTLIRRFRTLHFQHDLTKNYYHWWWLMIIDDD